MEFPTWVKEDVWVETQFGVPAMFEHLKTDLALIYSSKCKEIEACKTIDELMDWRAQLDSLALYHRKRNERMLEYTARRYHLRVCYQLGRLLLEIPENLGGRPKKTQEVDLRGSLRVQAAERIGLGEFQYKQALAVGRLPKEQFEAMAERPIPPSLQDLVDTSRGHELTKRQAKTVCQHLAKVGAVLDQHDVQPHDIAKLILSSVPEEVAKFEAVLSLLARAKDEMVTLRKLPDPKRLRELIAQSDQDPKVPPHEAWVSAVLEVSVEIARARDALGSDGALLKWAADSKLHPTFDPKSASYRGEAAMPLLQMLVGIGRHAELAREKLEAATDCNLSRVWQEEIKPAIDALTATAAE